MNRHEVIQALKKKFPLNNPESWSKVSNRQLREWEREYLTEANDISEDPTDYILDGDYVMPDENVVGI